MDSTKTIAPSLQQRIATLRWAIPLGFSLVAILYQIGPAKWVHDAVGEEIHYVVEILFFATAGPLLAYRTLSIISRWLDEKDLAESKARMSDRRLASITTASADAILGIDQNGRVQSWNRGAEFLFGYSEKEFVGRSLLELFASGESAIVELHWLQNTVRQGGYLRGHETTCVDRQGLEKIVELTATDLLGLDGESVGISVIMRDITVRKKRDQEIRELNASLNQQVVDRTLELAEKLNELEHANQELYKLDQVRSEFVSLVSHQIRAPLTNMHGAVDRMRLDCEDLNPSCTRMIPILNQQIIRLDRLVAQVLNAARIEAKEITIRAEPISVIPLVAQVAEENRERFSDRDINLPTKPGLPLVYADRLHVTEVLANLLDNADKYSPPGTAVQFDIRADQREVVLSIKDSGPGIAADDLEKIFEKFYRTDSSDSQAVYGYGLGLYLCRSLMEAQGGRIWVENDPGGGAIFSISLPIWYGDHEQ